MNNLFRRKALIKDLLLELKETTLLLDLMMADIEKKSADYYEEAYNEGCEELQIEIDKYKTNNDRLKSINLKITASVNMWYDFTKNTKELAKLIYPFLYLVKKHKLQKSNKKMNEEIQAITIENRFIKERLTSLVHQLEISALKKIKSGSSYCNYEQLLLKKDRLFSELEYLIPTIPGLCPATIGIHGIAELLEKLAAMEAA